MFEVGDKVKLVRISRGEKRGFWGKEYRNNLGKVFTISDIRTNIAGRGIYARLEETTDICPYLSDLELVNEKKFTKDDLKDGDIVTYRDKHKAIVCECITKLCSINEKGLMRLADYDKDLKYTTGGYKKTVYDIIKVERPIQYETVFERKEEILDETEKRYLRGVIRPFRNDIDFITKKSCRNSSKNYIVIGFKNDDKWYFPSFNTSSEMYKGMEVDKEYTLEELGL